MNHYFMEDKEVLAILDHSPTLPFKNQFLCFSVDDS